MDFVYENKIKDYNFRKYSTDEDLLKKIRTGKGDERTSKYNGLGEILYVKVMFGSTQPIILEQDFIYGDNDILSAKAMRYRMQTEEQYVDTGFTKEWTL